MSKEPLPTRFIRLQTIAPFVANDPPWVTEPSVDQVLALRDRVPGIASDEGTRGHLIYPVFRDVSGHELPAGAATVTFRSWLRTYEPVNNPIGSLGGGWVGIKSQSAATHRQGYTVSIQQGDLFVEIQAVGTVGSATTVEFWAAEIPNL